VGASRFVGLAVTLGVGVGVFAGSGTAWAGHGGAYAGSSPSGSFQFWCVAETWEEPI
jgi:hypothetical protein